MAEFQEVMKQWRRMCADGSEEYSCQSCKMYSEIDESVCHGIPDEYEAKIIERYVMEWAAEHPETVYPTWVEWLVEIGILPEMMSTIPSMALEAVKEGLSQHIPAGIAQKLGLEPKNG